MNSNEQGGGRWVCLQMQMLFPPAISLIKYVAAGLKSRLFLLPPPPLLPTLCYYICFDAVLRPASNQALCTLHIVHCSLYNFVEFQDNIYIL